jgi:hypothetical protein
VGAHIDSDPQFQYLIHGRRRAHIWTPERWNSRPRNSREAWRYIDEAETFDLGVGDAIYWPAGHYHVFESLGLSIAITFGFPEIAAPASAEEREALSGKHGFLNCPAPINPPALDRSARLCGQRDLPIVLLSTKVGSTQRVVSCNGFLIQLPALMDCTPIIARVNSGVPFTCNEVIAEVRTQVPASEVDDVTIDVLGAFVAAHALDVL